MYNACLVDRHGASSLAGLNDGVTGRDARRTRFWRIGSRFGGENKSSTHSPFPWSCANKTYLPFSAHFNLRTSSSTYPALTRTWKFSFVYPSSAPTLLFVYRFPLSKRQNAGRNLGPGVHVFLGVGDTPWRVIGSNCRISGVRLRCEGIRSRPLSVSRTGMPSVMTRGAAAPREIDRFRVHGLDSEGSLRPTVTLQDRGQ
jgi:hypothetical protein